MKSHPLLHDNKKIAILRPLNPEQAISRARELVVKNSNSEEFDKLLYEQPYTFIGIWGIENNKRAIIDNDNNVIDELQPGDSFVDYESLILLQENNNAK